MHVCAHAHNHICVCRSEDNLGYRSQVPHTLLSETDLSLGLVPTDVLEWLATNPQRSTLGIYPSQHWDSQQASSCLASRAMTGGQSPVLMLIRQIPQHSSHLPSPPPAFKIYSRGLHSKVTLNCFLTFLKYFQKSMSHVPKLQSKE